jgi:GNAT superfamily N-acetyltransferase
MAIVEATRSDAAAIATIHLEARRRAMPYLRHVNTDDETRAWFAALVGDRPASWWVARDNGQISGYMRVIGEDLDQLYVLPDRQRRGIGSLLVAEAKRLSRSVCRCGRSGEIPPRALSMWRTCSVSPATLMGQTRSTSRTCGMCGRRAT